MGFLDNDGRARGPAGNWVITNGRMVVATGAVIAAGIAAALVFHNPDEHSVTPAGPRLEGVAVADCAPWDGSATSIFLSDSTDLERLPPPSPYLQLIIYEPGARLADRRVEFGRVEGGSGIAVRCHSGGGCATTNRGAVEFEPPEGDGTLVGSYRITFTGDTVAGTFRARWSSRAAICG